ncbi:uracil-xanthine permease family protein [Vallitalea sp.]|jgi:uracil permease|uniref:uracil-xanthine permease family protein n=1 Tax=Vallitalea sp. TaxID=1882829 RepID=UPI0025CE1A02|nr:uracil-xanthine permease family protein [Vallitalea sp.]MCT4688474.1 uracil-xanthine permease family protein [Vallitalea sp.]
MENISTGKKLILGLQHVLAMFGATVLVPILTGLDPAIALFAAGVGTLLFHLCAKGKVPVFLGSSFAFIGAISITLNPNQLDDVSKMPRAEYLHNLSLVKGGIIVAGLVYVTMAIIIYFVGVEKIKKLFPPIVTGPMIIVIGLRLCTVATNSAFFPVINDNGDRAFNGTHAFVATIVVLTMVVVSIFAKGFFKMVPILISVTIGYLLCIPFGLLDTTAITNAAWFSVSDSHITEQILTVPSFTMSGIIAIAPIALVVFIEHIGDITTNGAVVGKNFLEDPGIHRTMLGDGVATVFAGLVGAPANTTYSENTGVLAVTKVYNPAILRIAAVIAIFLSMIGKFGAVIRTIPGPVMGGISIILFGMIASVGVRILISSNLDFTHSRNLLISAIVLVVGIGVDSFPLVNSLTLSGLAIAALIGVILNLVLPKGI